MKVITEETIRQLLRKQQLHSGEALKVSEPSIITPSAQSYLREHQIQVLQLSQNSNDSDNLQTSTSCAREVYCHDELSYLDNEILKLRDLLYFPLLADDFFDEQLWQYWQRQQLALEEFKVKQYKVPLQMELSLPRQVFNFKLCSWRLWQCSVMSLRRQLEYVESLLKPYDTISQSFSDWISQIEGILDNS